MSDLPPPPEINPEFELRFPTDLPPPPVFEKLPPFPESLGNIIQKPNNLPLPPPPLLQPSSNRLFQEYTQFLKEREENPYLIFNPITFERKNRQNIQLD